MVKVIIGMVLEGGNLSAYQSVARFMHAVWSSVVWVALNLLCVSDVCLLYSI